MRRREQREHIFKLLFMKEFNSNEEMTEQLSMYFDSLDQLSEEDEAYMKEKCGHVLEQLSGIDGLLNETSGAGRQSV